MHMPVSPPPGPVRTWATDLLERFVADVERGLVVPPASGGRFPTLPEAHSELCRRRQRDLGT